MDDKYVFLDRDGVINKDPGEVNGEKYVMRWEDFYFLPGTLEALKKLTVAGYKSVIISNQQGVGKGLFSVKDLEDITKKMLEKIKQAGGDVAGVYYCTHVKEENCSCRKPKPGLFERAKKELGIDLEGRYYLGDTERDMEAGRAAGLKTILVLSGKSTREQAGSWQTKPDLICDSILEAADLIIGGI